MTHFIRNHLRLFLALIAGILATVPMMSYAEEPIDQTLEQALNKREKAGFKELTESVKEAGNIYDVSYALVQKAALKDATTAFTSISKNLNSQYKCSLTATDIANITVTNSALNAALAGLATKSAFAVSGDAAVKSCIKVAQCVKKGDDNTDTPENYNQETYPTCTNTIQQAFTETIEIIEKQNRLDAANHGDDIFYNGKLDDSPFDLLADIQRIGDVLFEKNEKAPEITLYDFDKQGGSSSNTSDTRTPQDDLLAYLSNNEDIGSDQLLSLNSSQGSITDSYIGSNQASLQTDTVALQQLQTYNQQLTQKTVAGPYGLICATTLPTSGGVAALTLTQQAALGTILEQSLYSYTHTLNPQSTTNIGSPPSGNNGSSSSQDQNDPTLNNLTDPGSADSFNPTQPDASQKSCISKCSSQPASDKMLCIAKCMCFTKYSSNGVFGIRACVIPVPNPQIVGDKKVKSVEGAADEINHVLRKTRDSGQLMKHIKPKEFLDSSLQKLKLNKITSFDMNVSFKPVGKTADTQEKEEEKKSEDDASTNRAQQGTYDEDKVGIERNKYVVMKNPIQQNQSNSNLGSEDIAPPPKEPNPETPYTLAKTMNNDMLDNMGIFVAQNVKLWLQVSDSLKTMNVTAGALKKKIEREN